jgi:hypothetical protein
VRRPSLSLLLVILGLLAGCRRGARAGEGCLDCHEGLEAASATHAGCVSCHGGNASTTAKAAAHEGMYGAGNPSSPDRWDKACGPCHRDQVDRMTSGQMFTNAGMIAQIQATWEGERPGVVFAAEAGKRYRPDGSEVTLTSVTGLDDLSGELYRKFCSRCHLGAADDDPNAPRHPAGCAACHFPYGEGATYEGGDETVRGEGPHSATHAMHGLPPMTACTSCHDRSGRTALSYQGLLDGNNALVPTRGGLPGPVAGTEGRSFTHVVPDVHFEAGMECIDCHTSREVMGDGFAHANMEGQLEIRCEDCHGSGTERPRFVEVTRESDPPVRESRQYSHRIVPGTRVALTSKGRPFSNVFEDGGVVQVAVKRTGKLLVSRVITGSAAHAVVGHERLECSACHSRAVPQCYGCHTTYDKRTSSWDFVKDEDSPGEFSETEDYRTLSPFPLAVNGRGGIAPVTPGCQTFVTVIEADGTVSKEESVARYRGKPQMRFVPLLAHNTGRRAVGCAECHGEPAYLGFGQSFLEQGSVRSTLLCPRNPKKALDGFLSMDEGRIVSHAAIARDGARPLSHEEVRSTLAVNLCLVCHAKPEDPIYRKKLDHAALQDILHRRLLAPAR